MGEAYGIETKKCAVCEKLIYTARPSMWGYKKGFNYYCSYGCMRKAQTKEAQKEKEHSKNGYNNCVEAIDAKTGRVVAEFATMRECIEKVPFKSWHKLQGLIEKGEPFEGRIYRVKHNVTLSRHATRGKEVVVLDAKTGEIIAEYPTMQLCAEAAGLKHTSSLRSRMNTGKVYNGRIYKMKKDYLEGK